MLFQESDTDSRWDALSEATRNAPLRLREDTQDGRACCAHPFMLRRPQSAEVVIGKERNSKKHEKTRSYPTPGLLLARACNYFIAMTTTSGWWSKLLAVCS